MAEHLRLCGQLKGHEGQVTALATSGEKRDMLVSASRDRSIMVWNLTRTAMEYGRPLRRLTGHGHFVSDVTISNDGHFALSGSWDGSLRLWDITTGAATRHFVGHSKDVLSVAFSADNRQIISGSRDRTVKLWNTLGECKYTFEEGGHTEWVSSVKFSPNTAAPIVVSAGWDRLVKVWSLTTFKLKTNLVGHSGYVNTVSVSPDGSLCASGGKDGVAMLWDLNEGKHLYSLEAGSMINSLCFSPNRYWLCAATQNGVKIWDLESKGVVADLTKSHPDFAPQARDPNALSLAWSSDGVTLFAGYSDNVIRVWEVPMSGL